MSKVGVDKSFLDNPRFGQNKGYIEKMLKQNTEKDYVLNFNSTESIYREIEKLDIEEIAPLLARGVIAKALRKKAAEKAIKKYDPVVKKHVLFKEGKIK